jgi:hypothetical protein
VIGPRKVDKPLVLYGYGKLGHLAEEIFKELKIPIHGIVDKLTYWAKDSHLPKDPIVAVCVASEPYSKIVEHVKEIGFSDIAPVYDIIEAYPEVGIHNGWFAGQLSPEDRAGISAVSLGFMDKLSITHYYAFVDWRKYHDEIDYVPEASENLSSTLADIRRRQRVFHYHDYPIANVTIHTEGCELKTLEENIGIIKQARPEIKTACYHSRDGLWAIEKFLMDSLPDYLWRFRMTAYMGQGAYIYGYPKERAL